MGRLIDRLFPAPATEDEPVTASIVDAALEQFELVGIRKSSVEEVATRAGLGRATVYRYFPNKDQLVQAVGMREVRRLFAEVETEVAKYDTAEERVAHGFALAVSEINRKPLYRKLLQIEPAHTLPLLTTQGAPLIQGASAFLAELIRNAQQDGLLDPNLDPEPVAEILARIAHSLLLTPEGTIPIDDLDAASAFARRHITPLLRPNT